MRTTKKFFGLAIGLVVLVSAAFADAPGHSLEEAVNRMAEEETSLYTGDGGAQSLMFLIDDGQNAGGFSTMMAPVPEPAGMAALVAAIGGLVLRRKRSSRP